jgi:hypothetical protein
MKIKKIENRVEEAVEVIDGAGIVPRGCYFCRGDVERIVEGKLNYQGRSDYKEEMLNRIKYAN